MKRIFDKKRGKFIDIEVPEEKKKLPTADSLISLFEALREEIGKDGEIGPPGKDGINGRDGANGKDGASGKNGIDGKSGRDGLNGKNGADGRGISSIAQPSPVTIQIQYTDGSLQNLTLPAGKDGRDIEFRSTETHVQWSYKDEDTWTNLMELPKKSLMGLRGGGANYLKDIQDIKLTNLSDGQTITYNATLKRWVNSAGGAEYIRKDGTTTTTDSIPFAEGAQFGTAAQTLISNAGLVTKYNGNTVVAGGVPAIIAQINSTGNSAAISDTSFFTAPTSGMYRIFGNLRVSTAATSSSTLGGITIKYTEPDNSVAMTPVMGGFDENATAGSTTKGNATKSIFHGSMELYIKGTSSVTYAVAYSSSGITGMQYGLHLKAEFLG